jgi:hypothetical protein
LSSYVIANNQARILLKMIDLSRILSWVSILLVGELSAIFHHVFTTDFSIRYVVIPMRDEIDLSSRLNAK